MNDYWALAPGHCESAASSRARSVLAIINRGEPWQKMCVHVCVLSERSLFNSEVKGDAPTSEQTFCRARIKVMLTAESGEARSLKR